MNKKSKIVYPEIYQGSNKSKNYFEGWYFRHLASDKKTDLVLIPGVSYEKNNAHAFIQIITGQPSVPYYIRYDISEFSYSKNDFSIKIGPNHFSSSGISIDIDRPEINLKAEIKYSKFTKLENSILCPNIMGYFAYIRFMECYHGLISLKHRLKGSMVCNNITTTFDNGIGYIEKDWGRSFPEKYIWLQCNTFNEDINLFTSIARIPFMGLHFKGFISVVTISGKQYRFATYNRSSLNLAHNDENKIHIELKKGSYLLVIDAIRTTGSRLKAPKFGNMTDEITETIHGDIEISFYEGGKLILNDKGTNAGIEVIGY